MEPDRVDGPVPSFAQGTDGTSSKSAVNQAAVRGENAQATAVIGSVGAGSNGTHNSGASNGSYAPKAQPPSSLASASMDSSVRELEDDGTAHGAGAPAGSVEEEAEDDKDGDGEGEADDGASEASSHYSHCNKCKKGDEGETLLLCDRCPRAFHLACLGMGALPEEDPWHCAMCKAVLDRQAAREAARQADKVARAADKEAKRAAKDAERKAKDEERAAKAAARAAAGLSNANGDAGSVSSSNKGSSSPANKKRPAEAKDGAGAGGSAKKSKLASSSSGGGLLGALQGKVGSTGATGLAGLHAPSPRAVVGSAGAGASSGALPTSGPKAPVQLGLLAMLQRAGMGADAAGAGSSAPKVSAAPPPPPEHSATVPLGAALSVLLWAHRSANEEAAARAAQEAAAGAGAGDKDGKDKDGHKPREYASQVARARKVESMWSDFMAKALAKDKEQDSEVVAIDSQPIHAGAGASSSSSSSSAAVHALPSPLPGLDQAPFMDVPVVVYMGRGHASVSVSCTTMATALKEKVDWARVAYMQLPQDVRSLHGVSHAPSLAMPGATGLPGQEQPEARRTIVFPVPDEDLPGIDADGQGRPEAQAKPLSPPLVRDTLGLTDAQLGDVLSCWDFLQVFGRPAVPGAGGAAGQPLLQTGPAECGEDLVTDRALGGATAAGTVEQVTAVATGLAITASPLPLPQPGAAVVPMTPAASEDSEAPLGLGSAAKAAPAADPAAASSSSLPVPSITVDTSSCNLEDFVASLRARDFRGYRLLSRYHVALLRLLLKDRDMTKGTASGADGDGDEDMEPTRGPGGRAAAKTKTPQDTIADTFNAKMGARESEQDPLISQVNVLTWPEVLRRALFFGPLGAYLRPHLSARALAVADSLLHTPYPDLSLDDRLMLLKGLVDAVTACDTFGNYCSDVIGRRVEELLVQQDDEDAAAANDHKEDCRHLRAKASDKTRVYEAVLAAARDRERAAREKEREDKKKAKAAAKTGQPQAKPSPTAAGAGASGAGDDDDLGLPDSEWEAKMTRTLEEAGLPRSEIRMQLAAAVRERNARRQAQSSEGSKKVLQAELAGAARGEADFMALASLLRRARDSGLGLEGTLPSSVARGKAASKDSLALPVGMDEGYAACMVRYERLRAEEEVTRTTEAFQRAMEKRREKYARKMDALRIWGLCLGQDRYYRSYWVLAGDRSRVWVEIPADASGTAVEAQADVADVEMATAVHSAGAGAGAGAGASSSVHAPGGSPPGLPSRAAVSRALGELREAGLDNGLAKVQAWRSSSVSGFSPLKGKMPGARGAGASAAAPAPAPEPGQDDVMVIDGDEVGQARAGATDGDGAGNAAARAPSRASLLNLSRPGSTAPHAEPGAGKPTDADDADMAEAEGEQAAEGAGPDGSPAGPASSSPAVAPSSKVDAELLARFQEVLDSTNGNVAAAARVIAQDENYQGARNANAITVRYHNFIKTGRIRRFKQGQGAGASSSGAGAGASGPRAGEDEDDVAIVEDEEGGAGAGPKVKKGKGTGAPPGKVPFDFFAHRERVTREYPKVQVTATALLAAHAPEASTSRWAVIDSFEGVQQLLSWLDTRGVREAALAESITSHLPMLKLHLPPTTQVASYLRSRVHLVGHPTFEIGRAGAAAVLRYGATHADSLGASRSASTEPAPAEGKGWTIAGLAKALAKKSADKAAGGQGAGQSEGAGASSASDAAADAPMPDAPAAPSESPDPDADMADSEDNGAARPKRSAAAVASAKIFNSSATGAAAARRDAGAGSSGGPGSGSEDAQEQEAAETGPFAHLQGEERRVAEAAAQLSSIREACEAYLTAKRKAAAATAGPRRELSRLRGPTAAATAAAKRERDEKACEAAAASLDPLPAVAIALVAARTQLLKLEDALQAGVDGADSKKGAGTFGGCPWYKPANKDTRTAWRAAVSSATTAAELGAALLQLESALFGLQRARRAAKGLGPMPQGASAGSSAPAGEAAAAPAADVPEPASPSRDAAGAEVEAPLPQVPASAARKRGRPSKASMAKAIGGDEEQEDEDEDATGKTGAAGPGKVKGGPKGRAVDFNSVFPHGWSDAEDEAGPATKAVVKAKAGQAQASSGSSSSEAGPAPGRLPVSSLPSAHGADCSAYDDLGVSAADRDIHGAWARIRPELVKLGVQPARLITSTAGPATSHGQHVPLAATVGSAAALKAYALAVRPGAYCDPVTGQPSEPLAELLRGPKASELLGPVFPALEDDPTAFEREEMDTLGASPASRDSMRGILWTHRSSRRWWRCRVSWARSLAAIMLLTTELHDLCHAQAYLTTEPPLTLGGAEVVEIEDEEEDEAATDDKDDMGGSTQDEDEEDGRAKGRGAAAKPKAKPAPAKGKGAASAPAKRGQVVIEDTDDEDEEEESAKPQPPARRTATSMAAAGKAPAPAKPVAQGKLRRAVSDTESEPSGSEDEGRPGKQGKGAARAAAPKPKATGRAVAAVDLDDDEDGGSQGTDTEDEGKGGKARGRSQEAGKKRARATSVDEIASQATQDEEEDGASEAGSHEEACYECGAGGRGAEFNEEELLMCEGCPHVSHPSCAGLAKVPRGDWFCKECRANPCPSCSRPVESSTSILCGPEEDEDEDEGRAKGKKAKTAAKPKPKAKAGCGKAYHLTCVGLRAAPEGDWYCPRCSRK